MTGSIKTLAAQNLQDCKG